MTSIAKPPSIPLSTLNPKEPIMQTGDSVVIGNSPRIHPNLHGAFGIVVDTHPVHKPCLYTVKLSNGMQVAIYEDELKKGD